MSLVINSVHGVTPEGSRPSIFPAIRWGAIFAGIVAGLAIQLVLALLGLASGLTAIDIDESGAGVANVGTWAATWHGFSMLAAAFTGGYVAAHMSGLMRTTDGLFHGFVTWSATTLMFALLSLSALGGLFGGVFNQAGNMAAPIVNQSLSGEQSGSLSTLIERATGQIGVNVDAEDLGALRQSIAAGDREEAIGLLTEITPLEREQAATVVDQALILSGSPEQASAQARNRANQAIESASWVSWGVFAAVILSLALGVGGGAVGVVGNRRTRHAAKNIPTLDASESVPESTDRPL